MKKINQFKIITQRVAICVVIFGMFFLFPTLGYAKPSEIATVMKQLEKQITFKVEQKSLKEILYLIQEESGIRFTTKELNNIDQYSALSVDVENQPVSQILNELLAKTPYAYVVSDNKVVIREQSQPLQETPRQIKGLVVEADGKTPIVGATILVVGQTMGGITDANGRFALTVKGKVSIEVSFVGKVPQVVVLDARTEYVIALQNDNIFIDEVVVTGIFTRKAESYAGSSVTVTAKDLKRVGNQNILQSLKNLDPSLYIMDNLTMGSNPNQLPSMQMRGMSSLPNEVNSSLKGNYENKPNQPLFILDGFEASIEKIFDLDMNRVESVTILKDAAAKALYGSKAANGVVVVETKRLAGAETRVNYVGSLDVTVPDLTSYNLCNAEEKLQAEKLEGVYDNTTFPINKMALWELYDTRMKLIKDGLDTYWLSKPLQTGIGHKHNLSVEVGDSHTLRGILDFSYNKVDGVMKGSDRVNIAGTASMSYRLKDFLFRNVMGVVSNTSHDSPYGDFSVYSTLNPYLRAVDNQTGEYLRWADASTANPLYNSVLGTLYKQSYLNFTNNFYIEWSILPSLKMTGRLGIDMKRSDSDEFLPSSHSSFQSITLYGSNEDKLKRGSYAIQSGKGNTVSADINLTYTKAFGKHDLFVNGRYNISNRESRAVEMRAEGFPSNMGADVTFARQYASNSRPTTASTLVREIGFLAVAGYSYDSRYLLDLTYTIKASSLYGKTNRWSPGWSTAVGWNVHNENFLKNNEAIKKLKLRGSIGLTGNQNFNTNQTITTYQYYTSINYQGLVGAYMSALSNPEVKWEQRKDFNVGFELEMYKLTANFDFYNGVTENMVTDLSIPTSAGFSVVKDNLGRVRNRGFELTLGYTIFQNRNGYLNLFASGVSEKNYIVRLSDAMRTYNEKQIALAADKTNSKPVLMYQDGQSMNTIWAVPSKGIDPTTGYEVYVKQDGSLTTAYSSLDMIAAGDSNPKFRGNVGFSGEYKGVGLSVTCRYLAGGDMYNQTLVDKVENVDIYKQVDRRVLLGRWQYPGQQTQFKRLQGINSGTTLKTQATTRFIQKRNEFDLASISVYYELPNRLLQKTPIKRLRTTFYMNDVVKFSSIEIERGLSYPFAHTFSFSLTATF